MASNGCPTATIIASTPAITETARPQAAPARIGDLDEGRRLLDAQADVLLVTAPGLAAFAGPGYWRAVELELGRSVVIDCGEDAGLALAALRAGCRDLLFTGEARLAAKLADLAGQQGGRLRRHLPERFPA